MRRLELGASVAEVARACKVNPNVLHRWRREVRDFCGKAFSGPAVCGLTLSVYSSAQQSVVRFCQVNLTKSSRFRHPIDF